LPRQNGTIVLAWDTKNIEYARNYTITAIVCYTRTDKYPADDMLAAGPITVRILSDLNGDGKVDGADIALAGMAFASYGPNYLHSGSRPCPEWNPYADINGDNKVDSQDIALIAMNFGM
jgi:uncharacterized protein (DUF2141 family)